MFRKGELGRSSKQPALASPSKPCERLTTNSAANAVERVPFVGLLHFLRLENRSHGLQVLAAYTFAKLIDDAGDNIGAAIGGSF